MAQTLPTTKKEVEQERTDLAQETYEIELLEKQTENNDSELGDSDWLSCFADGAGSWISKDTPSAIGLVDPEVH